MKNGFITKKEETKGNKDKLLFYHFMHHGNENIKQHTGKKSIKKRNKENHFPKFGSSQDRASIMH